jgi:beta-glucosidase
MRTCVAGVSIVGLVAMSSACDGRINLGSNATSNASSGSTCASTSCTSGSSGATGSSAGASGSGTGATGSSGSSGSGAPAVVEEVPEPAVVATCSDSSEELPFTPGIGVDIPQATGYTPDTTIPQKAAALLAGANSTELANQMRGTIPNTATTDFYRTLDDPNTNIKGFLFRDGTRGVNLDEPTYIGAYGTPQVSEGSAYSTAFPVAAARAAAWDLALENQIGQDIGDEVLGSKNTLLKAPGVDLLRHPAWGRAQESYGEDAFAVGRMGTAFAGGVQQYVPACATHLAAYNIENTRQDLVSVLDSQTLHEVYGRPFEMVVQEGGVACVMASYNSIQVSDGPDTGTYKDTNNAVLLTGMLRDTWGFGGFVMSDLWAMPNYQSLGLQASVYAAVAQGAVAAGLDLETPWALNFSKLESDAPPDELSASATRIVEQKLRFNIADPNAAKPGLRSPVTSLGPNGITNNAAHIADAEQQAEESMVLLKNEQSTLPIDRSHVKTVAVIGLAVPWTLPGTGQSGTVQFATDIRLGDLGSSQVNADPATTVGPAAGIQAAAGSAITVVSGSEPNLASNADFVVVVAGLTAADEGEDYTGASDRADSNGNPNLALDAKSGTNAQNTLITTVAAMNKPMVVVLEGGSAIDMPWLASVPAVVMAWYPGQTGGTALGRLLFGDVNFSGKLPITWPKSEADEPVFNTASTMNGATTMGYYVGYRYFDENNITPLYAFGSGQSYTTFQYGSLVVPCGTVSQGGVVDVWVSLTNTGSVPGDEVSYLFVSYPATSARRSVKELKGFHRTPAALQPGETTTFTIPLRIQDLKYWDTSANPPGWVVESGPVQIMVGPSADNLPLQGMLTVQ